MPCSNAAKTRNQLKFAGVPQTGQPISAASRPTFTILTIVITMMMMIAGMVVYLWSTINKSCTALYSRPTAACNRTRSGQLLSIEKCVVNLRDSSHNVSALSATTSCFLVELAIVVSCRITVTKTQACSPSRTLGL